MAAEVVAVLSPVPDGLLVDATVGGGGHSLALLTARPGLRLLGIDRDPSAWRPRRSTARRAFGDRARLERARFEVALGDLVGIVDRVRRPLRSRGQLAAAGPGERGFSYRRKARSTCGWTQPSR